MKAPATTALLVVVLVSTLRGAPRPDRIEARDFGVRCDGLTDDTGGLVTASAAANAAGRSLYLPAGTCLLNAAPSGVLLKLSAPHIWLRGEGAGITVVKLTGAVALAGELVVVALSGEGQGVEGVTFLYGAGLRGAFTMNWVAIAPGGFDSTVRDCEFSGGYGGNTAGGAAVTSYTPLAGLPQVKTALDAAVSPGVNIILPTSGTAMAGIYMGKRLVIGSGDAAEDVVVSARTAANFTAAFAHAHAATDTITDRNYNTQRILVDNNYIHDCFACSGIILNSGGSLVRGNKIVNVGLNNFQHGIYVQSGNNRIVHNWIEGVSGYGIHGHKAVPQEDSSGDVYDGNTIVNYGRQCIIVDSIASASGPDGVNPEVPAGASLDRYATITNNTCRILKGAGSTNIIQGIGVQIGARNTAGAGGVLIVNNTLEDACGTTPSCVWISTGSFPNAAVSGNHLRVLTGGAGGQTGINSNGGTDVSVMGNMIENWSIAGAALYLASNTTAIGNTIVGAGGPMVAINGNNVVLCNNTIVQTGTAGIQAHAPSTGVQICGNNLTGPPGSAVLDLGQMAGSIHDNSIAGGYLKAPPAAAAGLQIYNNDGEFRWTTTAPSHAVVMTRSMGRLMDFPAGGNPLTAGLAVADDGSGNILTALAAGAAFQGFAVQDKTSAVGSAYIAGQESAEFDFAQTDGPWSAGHFGILSAIAGGTIHDIGMIAPRPNYYYVRFLDNGSAAGSARVLLSRLATSSVGYFTFATLPTNPAPGTLVYCTDCKNLTDDRAGTFDSLASAGGHGTNVLYENRSWRVR